MHFNGRLSFQGLIIEGSIAAADVVHSANFYNVVIGALGLRRAKQISGGDGSDAVRCGLDHPTFLIDNFCPHSVQQHTAFTTQNRPEVDPFHKAS